MACGLSLDGQGMALRVGVTMSLKRFGNQPTRRVTIMRVCSHQQRKSKMKTYEQLFQTAKGEGAKNPLAKAVTDLIAQAIENKTYKFVEGIRDRHGNIALKKWDVIVLFSWANDPVFWAVEDPEYDGNVMRFIRSNSDGSDMLQVLYEG
jgi:hypothetical protein